MTGPFEFEVALSFAGERRAFVEEVASRLKNAGVQVFYDDYEKSDLWGRDLAAHLDEVYRKRARFVVPFIDGAYAQKAWPRQEFRSALARAVQEREPYLLPVRFDETDLPGLAPTIGYLDGRTDSPDDVAKAILAKLGKESRTSASSTRDVARPVAADHERTREVPQPGRVPKVVPTDFNPYAELDRALEVLQKELTVRCEDLKAQGFAVNSRSVDRRFELRILRHGRTLFSLDAWIGGDFGDKTMSFNDAGGRGTTGWASAEWNRDRGMCVLKVFSMSLLPDVGSEARLTPAELAEIIWGKLCDRIEQADRGY
jgi:hypothetical protein